MKKILIVDDSPTIRRMVAASLRSLQDVLLEEACDGLEAIESLARDRVSLMILDLNMPDMHGLDVLQFVQAHRPQYGALPVIVLTTKYDAESRKAAMENGAARYMTKPFDPEALRDQAMGLLGIQ